MKYLLNCLATNTAHTTFAVFDGTGAHCGVLTIATADLRNFLVHSWDGRVAWHGLTPVDHEGQEAA